MGGAADTWPWLVLTWWTSLADEAYLQNCYAVMDEQLRDLAPSRPFGPIELSQLSPKFHSVFRGIVQASTFAAGWSSRCSRPLLGISIVAVVDNDHGSCVRAVRSVRFWCKT